MALENDQLLGRTTRIWLGVIAIPLAVVLGFQNCSNIDFEVDETKLDVAKNSSLVIDGGNQYTNKQLVPVELNLKIDDYEEMRFSLKPDFSDTTWVPIAQSFRIDLKEEYAPDGTKDGFKKIYVQMKSPIAQLNKTVEGQIGLDTVPPKIEPKGLLKNGLEGRSYALNESVGLEWSGRDIPSVTGFTSGLNEGRGVQIRKAVQEDCTEGSTESVLNWTGYKESHQVQWPQQNPLDVFYYCVYLSDRAGNTQNYLSQPFTGLWRVYVGENNQGNGGSLFAPNVRFKKPSSVTVDQRGNIFISDTEFHNLRIVQSGSSNSSGVISNFIGTGKSGATVEGNTLESPLGAGAWGFKIHEASNKGYLSAGSGLFVAEFNADRSQAELKKIISIGRLAISLRSFRGVDSLLIYHYQRFVGNDPSAGAYIYDVPLSEFESRTAPMVVADLAPFRIAGNGTIPMQTHRYIAGQKVNVLKNPGATDPDQSVGRPGTIHAGEDGNIYFSSHPSGSGQGIGQTYLRRLIPQVSAVDPSIVVYQQEWLLGTPGWAYQLEQYKDAVYISHSGGFKKFDLTQRLSSHPVPSLASNPAYGFAIERNSTGARFIISETYQSRIGFYDEAFNLIGYAGKSVYRENEPDALTTLIGNPTGLFEAPDGTLYFYDSLNNALRAKSSDGRVFTVAGAPHKKSYVDVDRSPFSEVGLLSAGNLINYISDLIGDFENGRKRLYLGGGSSGRVHYFDLVKNEATLVAAKAPAPSDSWDRRFFWPIMSLALTEDKSSVIGVREFVWTKSPKQTKHESYVTIFSRADVAADGILNNESDFAGDPMYTRSLLTETGLNPLKETPGGQLRTHRGLLKTSKDGLLYATGTQFTIHYPASQSFKGIKIDGLKRKSLSAFAVFHDGGDDLIVYRWGQGLRYFRLSRADALNPNLELNVTSKPLCLPGTSLNNALHFARGADNNLLISDSANGRILKYFINDGSGFKFTESCN